MLDYLFRNRSFLRDWEPFRDKSYFTEESIKSTQFKDRLCGVSSVPYAHGRYYPYYLKQRIASAVGHLSNKQAFELLTNHAGEQLKTIFLSHLSGENNTPEKAFSVFEPFSKTYRIEVTSRHASTELISL